MSAFETEPDHFIHWLSTCSLAKPYLDSDMPLGEQFVPRFLYKNYLNHVLNQIKEDAENKVTLICEPFEVVDAIPEENKVRLLLNDQRDIMVDKVILALGHHAASPLPFSISKPNVYSILGIIRHLKPLQAVILC